MKKLVSMICTVLYLHSFAQPSPDSGFNTPKASGEKVLMKAIAVIVNPDGNKKTPIKTINLTYSEC